MIVATASKLAIVWVMHLSLFVVQPNGFLKTERSTDGPYITRQACVDAIEGKFNDGTQGIATCTREVVRVK
jgi:hypothetical protein